MSLLRHAPAFDAAGAVRLARGLYGLDAAASPLPSERDQNFLLVGAGERFVLKIANALESRLLIEAQNALLEHVAPLGLCPRVLPALNGERIIAEPGGHLVRLLTWLPGKPLGTVERPPEAAYGDLGRRLGQLDRALAGFDHPALHREFHWDLARALTVVHEHSARIADPALRGLVERVAGYVAARDAHVHARLRRSVIHGDANDHNVLVASGQGPTPVEVTGLLDVGDAIFSYTVADPAIAIAYALLDKPDPLGTACTIAGAYDAENRLTDDELTALFGLVQLRLCASVCLAALQQPDRPGDAYLAVSQAPIARTLPILAGLHPDAVEEAIRRGLKTSAYGEQPAPRDPVSRTPGSSDPGVPSDAGGGATRAKRRRWIGPNLSVGYRRPLTVSRGWMQYLFDADGRQFLDGYNNVPHVGHAHPYVAEAAARQLRTVNTNTRYLHDGLAEFAERLTATLPEALRVCYFVNSGSEANELALRLARAHTRHRDLIVQDAAYHGNTTTLIEISPYKFNGPGGAGKPPWVHVVPLPDTYRRPGINFADAVGETLDGLRRRGVGPCGFIAETCPSVGGQIIPPPGYLAAAYEHVRAAGGVCIADEVQTAYGRLGTHFYAFEAHGVVPDIVVLGKPIGNGYPIGAVVTSREIAASFDNGMEFFSTFGGSTVSCAVGLAVLDVVRDERLQAHARRVGERLLGELRSLATTHAIVGDVRGSGLFLGVELVKDRESREPAPDAASDVVNGMREDGVLIGTDGPFHNVLKIRPPMPFGDGDAHRLAAALDAALAAVIAD